MGRLWRVKRNNVSDALSPVASISHMLSFFGGSCLDRLGCPLGNSGVAHCQTTPDESLCILIINHLARRSLPFGKCSLPRSMLLSFNKSLTAYSKETGPEMTCCLSYLGWRVTAAVSTVASSSSAMKCSLSPLLSSWCFLLLWSLMYSAIFP